MSNNTPGRLRLLSGLVLALLLMPRVSTAAEYAMTPAATSQTLYFRVFDSTSSAGALLTTLVYNTAGLTCTYTRIKGTQTAITLATQTATGSYSSGGFVHVGNGWYRLDIPDAVVASGVDDAFVECHGATGMVPTKTTISLNSGGGNVTVGGYASGQSPADYVLVTPSNKIATNSSGHISRVVLVDTLTTYTGDTPQTGDAFARLGAPAGASTAADIAAVKTDTALLKSYLCSASGSPICAAPSGVGLWDRLNVVLSTRYAKALELATGDSGITTTAATTPSGGTITLSTSYTGHGTDAFRYGLVVFETGPCSPPTSTGGAIAMAVTAYNSSTGLFTITAPQGGCQPTVGGGDIFHVKYVSGVPQTGDTFALANGSSGFSNIYAAVDTEIGAIKTKTDFLPSATAGAAGGLFIAGTNAATTITTGLTTTFTGNLTGSVGSVTGSVATLTTDPTGVTTLLSRLGTPVAASLSLDVANLKSYIGVSVVVAGSPTPTTTTFASASFTSNVTDGYRGSQVQCPDGTWHKVVAFAPSTDEVTIAAGEACASAFTGTVAVRFDAP